MAKKKRKEASWEEIGKSIGQKMEKDSSSKRWMFYKHCHGSGGGFYWLGFVGALVYYLTTAATFWEGVIGVIKAFVWPAFFVYEILRFLAA